MTTFAFPSIAPNDLIVEYVSNAQQYTSPISAAVTAAGRGGESLAMRLAFRNLTGAEAAEMRGFLVKLNGPEHRFTLKNYAEDNQGAFGGTPLVAGANQLGTTLDIDGCPNSITDWMKAGDWFGVNGELKCATLDANSDGGGNATLTFRPRLRSAPADNAPITTANATGIFFLSVPSVQMLNRPGKNGPLLDVSFVALEDVTA